MKSPTKKELVTSRARCLGLRCLEGIKARSDVKTAGVIVYLDEEEYFFSKEVDLIQLLKEAKALLGKNSKLNPSEPPKNPIQTQLF